MRFSAIRAPFLTLAFVTVTATACAAGPARPGGSTAAPPAKQSAFDAVVYEANAAIIDERYCRPIARMSARVVRACACSQDETFLSPDELAASCRYHLVVGQIPDDRALSVDEPALARCIALLDASLVGCVQRRLPRECELARIFRPAPGALALSRPVGSPCRAENGDEGFDAHFLCAPGLHCAGTCRASPPRRDACSHPLGLPPAIP